MFKIRISQDNWLVGPNCPASPDDIEMEVSDEVFSRISTTGFSTNWRYVNGDFILQDLSDDNSLKERRQKECFAIVDNRSPMWYSRLTDEQKTQLDEWYQAWLDVTETHVIPVKPDWL